DDVDAGDDIVSTATVTADQGVTASDSTTITVDAPEAPVAAVTISPCDQSDRGWSGEHVTYEFTVQNTGDEQDTYDLAVSSDWASSVTPQTLTLEPEASAAVTVTHSVPDGVASGDFDAGTVHVLSAGTGAHASATFTTTARVSKVEITPGKQTATAPPGATAEYTYTVANPGTEDEVYSLAISANWEASLSTTSVTVHAGGSVQVAVTHVVPADSTGGDIDGGVLIAACERASAEATFTTAVEEAQEPGPPVVDLFQVNNSSNPAWARATLDWAVSDPDGDLATVEVLMVINGSVVDSATYSVSGYEASGSCELRHRSRRGTAFDVVIIVTDSLGNTDSKTVSLSS
ncbi:MAG: hypothetical protein ACNA7X_07010, partial [Dehalococcoidia bacterium]